MKCFLKLLLQIIKNQHQLHNLQYQAILFQYPQIACDLVFVQLQKYTDEKVKGYGVSAHELIITSTVHSFMGHLRISIEEECEMMHDCI